MTRFHDLWSLLIGKPTERERLMERTRKALVKRDGAKRRKDKRDLGRALMELRECQAQRLGLGI